MRILVFTPYVPYPPNSGGRTRTFNLIKHLSDKHEISSFSFLRSDHPEPELSELKKYCRKVEIFRRKKSFSSVSKVLRTGFSPFPYLANMYYFDTVKRAIAEELEKNKYDLIHLETYYIMPNIPKTSVPILLAEQTIEYLVYQHYAETTGIWPLKPFFYIDAFKHKYWERYYWEKAKKVVAMSDEDKKTMLDLDPKLDVDVVPNGVDMKYFRAKIAVPKRNYKRFLFVGNFNWMQNREAANILAGKIWPLILKQLPEAKLWIVGREPTSDIQALASESVVVDSAVDDIREAYQGSDVLIAPLYGGGGTRYKVLEAMASGLPVVSTEIGIAGLGARHKVHSLVSNDPAMLAKYSVQLATDRVLSKNISLRARELVEKTFDWSVISAKLDRIYEETAKSS